jgi:saxitoxin biosynthesis operon SxtJ-like protein
MIREELKALKTGTRELRRFGLTVGGAFLLLGAWFAWRGRFFYPYLLAPSVMLIIPGLLFPGVLRRVYIGWMALAFALGIVVSTVLLTLFFYLIVTPIGQAARLLGKDFLSEKWNSSVASYWILVRHSKPKTKAEYEQQF